MIYPQDSIFQEMYYTIISNSLLVFLPKNNILDKKMQWLITLIKNSEDQIAFFYAHELGFRTCGGLSKCVKRRTGLTFQEFKESIRKNSHL